SQADRASASPGAATLLNARLEGAPLEAVAAPDEAGRALLTRAAEAMSLSARGWTRTLRLARTIADLDGSTAVRRLHIAEALIYRPSTTEGGSASVEASASAHATRRTIPT